MPSVILISVCILHVFLVLLVDRVVGQMRELIVLIGPSFLSALPTSLRCWIWRVVRLTGEASQALIVNVDPPRVETGDEDVDSQVELEPVDKKGVRDVSADYARFINWHLRYVIYLLAVIM